MIEASIFLMGYSTVANGIMYHHKKRCNIHTVYHKHPQLYAFRTCGSWTPWFCKPPCEQKRITRKMPKSHPEFNTNSKHLITIQFCTDLLNSSNTLRQSNKAGKTHISLKHVKTMFKGFSSYKLPIASIRTAPASQVGCLTGTASLAAAQVRMELAPSTKVQVQHTSPCCGSHSLPVWCFNMTWNGDCASIECRNIVLHLHVLQKYLCVWFSDFESQFQPWKCNKHGLLVEWVTSFSKSATSMPYQSLGSPGRSASSTPWSR